MAQFASWIHGNAVVPEFMGNPPLQFVPGETFGNTQQFSDVNGARRIDGAHFRIAPGSNNWFHAPIPTPAIVIGKFATLVNVIVLFNLEGGLLDHIVVSEAANNLIDRPGIAVTGNRLGELLDGTNVFSVNHDRIGFGICVSLHFTASASGKSPDDPPATLHISAVGGNFDHNL